MILAVGGCAMAHCARLVYHDTIYGERVIKADKETAALGRLKIKHCWPRFGNVCVMSVFVCAG